MAKKTNDLKTRMLTNGLSMVNKRIIPGLKSLAQFPSTDYVLNKKIASNLSRLSKADQVYNSTYKNIQEEFIDKDDEGKFKLDAEKKFLFKDVSTRKKYFEEIKKLDETPANVQILLFTEEEIEGTLTKKVKQVQNNGFPVEREYTPADMADIYELIDFSDEETEEIPPPEQIEKARAGEVTSA